MPNFDMPKDAYFDPNDLASEALTSGPHAALAAPAMPSDDRARGWSSALFPAKATKPDSTSPDEQNRDRAADEIAFAWSSKCDPANKQDTSGQSA